MIYPQGDKIFNAFNLTPFGKVKVVILGQDPYHGESQANGLSFSVSPSIKIPPSLQNIFKELYQDLEIRNQATQNSKRKLIFKTSNEFQSQKKIINF